MENDFTVLGEINTKGSIHSEHNISIGGLVNGDEINVDDLLAKNKISKLTRWFVVSATTVTNDTIYFVYLPYLKIGWHFYEKQDSGKTKIVKYIGDNSYCELARFLAIHISDSRDEFSYKGSILNDAVACLEEYDLKGAFSQLIVLVREVKGLQKCEKLYILHKSFLMLHQLEDSQEIEQNYFKGNLVGECDFTKKYKEIIKDSNLNFSIKEYVYDIIKLIKADQETSLNFWLRNVEIYIREQSSVSNERALVGELKRTITHLVGGVTDIN